MTATAFDGKIHVTGGLTPEGKISKEVDVYDLKSSEWSKGPEIPGTAMNGNGLAAYSTDKAFYLSGMDGKVYRLNKERWDAVGKVERPCIHHRLLPVNHDTLIVVAGATMSEHLKSVDRVVFDGKH